MASTFLGFDCGEMRTQKSEVGTFSSVFLLFQVITGQLQNFPEGHSSYPVAPPSLEACIQGPRH